MRGPGAAGSGRLVVVAAGFGLWRDGRHIVSARWGDIMKIRVLPATIHTGGVVALRILLVSGLELEVDASLAGWDAFVGAATGALPGMPSREQWGPTRDGVGGRTDALLFDRAATRRRDAASPAPDARRGR